MALCVVAVPAVAFADEGGFIELGLNVKGGQDSVAQGGSVELAVNVGVKDAPAASGSSVDLSVNVASKAVHRVSFVGYYCDEKGDVVTDGNGVQKKETIEVQDVLHGGHAAAPESLVRTDAADGQEYWVDGWYAYGADGSLQKVDLSTYEVEGGTTFVCYWKKGYMIRLDPNNGSDATTGAPVFDGTVDGAATGTIAAARDLDWEAANPMPDVTGASGNPGGFTPATAPVPKRPGYVFEGWYWGKEQAPRDEFGRVKLDDGGSGPVLDADDLVHYDFFRTYCQGGSATLYAKWSLDADLVRIGLADASAASGGAELWFWKGRGYTTQRPQADKEATPGFVIRRADVPDAGLDITKRLNIAYNPAPPISNQVFAGWGYQVVGEGGRLERVELVSASKPQGAAGFSYLLTPKAFDYVNAQTEFTGATEPDSLNPDNKDGRKAEWEALFGSARISVTAPFEVVFQKKGDNWATDPTDVDAYTADEIEGTKGGWTWIESVEQEFYNGSTAGDAASPVEVYVSGIDCTNMGAAGLIPARDGASDLRVFALYNEALAEGGTGANASLSDGTDAMRSVLFGYAEDGGANSAAVSASDPSKWIVLKPEGDKKVANTLYFGLDLTKVKLNRSAIAVGGGTASNAASTWKAPLANVKYTYSVVP